jgi:4-amino-4-deoxy-L-arabinose transferase-like glycosyltransferase
VGKKAPKQKRFNPTLVLLALLAVGLVIRVIFLVELERSGFADALSLDSRLYYDLARGMSVDGKLPAGAINFNPFYPVFLAAVFKLFGDGLLAPRIVQLLVGLFTIVLVYVAGTRLVEKTQSRRISGQATAIIAAAIATLSAPLVLYEGMLVATTFEVFFMTAAFLVALSLDESSRGAQAPTLGGHAISPLVASLLLGALCGVGALGRPNLFLLLVAALPIWLWARARTWRAGLIRVAFFLAGAALFLVPPIAYNAAKTGRFVPVTTHGGIGFYLGNRAGSEGIYRPLEDTRANVSGTLEDARAAAEVETGRSMTAAEVSDYYTRRTFDDIRRNPAAWVRLLARKLMLFFNGTDIHDMPNAYLYERSCPALKLLFFPFSVVAPLSLCGLVLLFRSGRNRGVVALFLGAALASVLLFFVNERYRLPALPILVLPAALSVVWTAREIALRRFRTVMITVAGALAFFLLVSHRTIVTMNPGFEYAFLGSYYAEHKNEAKAAEAFAEAYRLEPDKPEAIINYARILRQRGQLRESADMYARAYARSPRFPDLAIEYGFVLQLIGQLSDAENIYLEAFSSNRPQERLMACKLLAQTAAMEGKRSEALQWVKRALEIAPEDAQAADMLKRIEAMP